MCKILHVLHIYCNTCVRHALKFIDIYIKIYMLTTYIIQMCKICILHVYNICKNMCVQYSVHVLNNTCLTYERVNNVSFYGTIPLL